MFLDSCCGWAVAPFAPESALQAFLKDHPCVNRGAFGPVAWRFWSILGPAIALAFAVLIYGFVGRGLRQILQTDGRTARQGLSNFERALAYSLVPWLLFGVVILPLTGVSFFGIGSPFATPSTVWAFPFLLLLSSWYTRWGCTPLRCNERLLPPVPSLGGTTPTIARRTFLERGALILTSVVVAGVAILSSLSLTPSSGSQDTGTETAVSLSDAPSIFTDPRLASLVDSEVTSNDAFYRLAIDLFFRSERRPRERGCSR